MNGTLVQYIYIYICNFTYRPDNLRNLAKTLL